MRRVLSVGLVMMLLTAGLSMGLLEAAQQQVAALTGTARRADGQPLPNAAVQIRSYSTFEVVSRSITDPQGAFSFEGLQPGRYIVELVEAGKVAGMSSVVDVQPGTTLAVNVVAASSRSASGGGFKLFGLGPAATAAVLGAAGAAAVTAVVSTSPDASPSR